MEIQNTWSKEGINIHFESFVILWLTCTDVQMQFYCRVFVYESHILPKNNNNNNDNDNNNNNDNDNNKNDNNNNNDNNINNNNNNNDVKNM